MKKYSTYVFDLDGTLLDTLTDLAISTNYALENRHFPTHSVEEIRMMVGNGVRKLIERALPDGVENSVFESVFEDFRQHYSKHQTDHTGPYPGILEMLEALKRCGVKTAVVSNKYDGAVKTLCSHFFPGLIDVAIGERLPDVRPKPAPDAVYEALRQIDADPSTSVYIGDSDVDVKTAKAAGLPCVSVLWGFRDRQTLIEAGASEFISTPLELV